MKTTGKMILVAAMVALIMVPALGQAEMYVGIYAGPNFGANTDIDINISGLPTITAEDVKIDPAVIGGLKFGYWFTKEGFLGYSYPEWMKYLGFGNRFKLP